jgi:hypothetical protein
MGDLGRQRLVRSNKYPYSAEGDAKAKWLQEYINACEPLTNRIKRLDQLPSSFQQISPHLPRILFWPIPLPSNEILVLEFPVRTIALVERAREDGADDEAFFGGLGGLAPGLGLGLVSHAARGVDIQEAR